MAIRIWCHRLLFGLCLLTAGFVQAQDSPFGQTFQINTRLNRYEGKVSWLIVVRNEDDGAITPYLYDFTSTNNFWLLTTFARHYRVIDSEMQFGPPSRVIHNFCHLQDGMLDRESMVITLTGDLTPDRHSATCHIMKYKNYDFPVVEPEPEPVESKVAIPAAAAPAAPAAPASATSTITNAISNAVSNVVGSGVTGGISNAVSNLVSGAGAK